MALRTNDLLEIFVLRRDIVRFLWDFGVVAIGK